MKQKGTTPSFTLLKGDVLDKLKELPDNSVHCCITSPPYWGLRDYGVEGMIGLEPTIEEYLEKMVAVCREVKRVLRPDGTFWLNMGDCYAAAGYSQQNNTGGAKRERGGKQKHTPLSGLKPKDLVGQPWRLAFALQADGWWLRSEIIWAKGISFCSTCSGSCMPGSQEDRPTSSHEKLFILTKNAQYFYDNEAVKEKYTKPLDRWGGDSKKTTDNLQGDSPYESAHRERDMRPDPAGRTLRNVWVINPQGFTWEMCSKCKEIYDGAEYKRLKVKKIVQNGKEKSYKICHCGEYDKWLSHFATFPEDLVIPCIKAGISEKGACSNCGAPWERVVERTSNYEKREEAHAPLNGPTKVDSTGWKPPTINNLGWQPTCKCRKEFTPKMGGGGSSFKGHSGNYKADGTPVVLPKQTIGWEETCDCDNAKPVPCTVLDPFSGSGTTGVVALKHNCNYIGIELNSDYNVMALARLTCARDGLTLKQYKEGQKTFFQ